MSMSEDADMLKESLRLAYIRIAELEGELDAVIDELYDTKVQLAVAHETMVDEGLVADPRRFPQPAPWDSSGDLW
jgi:hypothetical protein